jgi:hypothetical protein
VSQVVLSEIWAWLLEAGVFCLAFRTIGWRKALAIAFLANLASCLVGLAVSAL